MTDRRAVAGLANRPTDERGDPSQSTGPVAQGAFEGTLFWKIFSM